MRFRNPRSIHPKNPFVCPFRKGLGPLHSYSFRMGLVHPQSSSIGKVRTILRVNGAGIFHLHEWLVN